MNARSWGSPPGNHEKTIGKPMEIIEIPWQNHWKIKGKRRLPDKQVYPVTAFFRLPERLGGPPETVEKAWKSMYFPAWRPGATRGLRKTWKNLINTNVALLHLVPFICNITYLSHIYGSGGEGGARR